MPTQEDINALVARLGTYRATLQIYLQQIATLGTAHAPPVIFHGIHECRQNIQQIKNTLRSWSAYVEDLPDDNQVALSENVTTAPTRIQQARRSLRAFLCHSSKDKPAIRKLYQRLQTDGIKKRLSGARNAKAQNDYLEDDEDIANDYKAKLLSQYSYQIKAHPNTMYKMDILWENIGSKVWTKWVRMGTVNPRDHISIFYLDNSQWNNLNRIDFTETLVHPGGIATFEVPLKCPSEPGSYHEYFRLVHDGHSWFKEVPTITINVIVVEAHQS